VTSKPDRFTKQMFFKCRDTNLFATGNAARNYNKVSNGIYGGDFSGGGSSGEFRYKAQHLLILLKSK
jgi:hypothetical protein